jgi:hypothetical protein
MKTYVHLYDLAEFLGGEMFQTEVAEKISCSATVFFKNCFPKIMPFMRYCEKM